MAQLKDTIINGDLVVTGSIVSDSLQAAMATATDSTLGVVKGDGNNTINIQSDGSIKVNDNGHTHTIANVDLLQTTLDNKLSLTGGTLTGGLTVGGAVTASSFNASSDRRLKENLSPYKYDNSILDLPVYTFDYVNGQKNQLGCMAQDLQKICPEIVNEGENGYLSIQESKIVYLLLMEVKKLKEELNTLKIKE